MILRTASICLVSSVDFDSIEIQHKITCKNNFNSLDQNPFQIIAFIVRTNITTTNLLRIKWNWFLWYDNSTATNFRFTSKLVIYWMKHHALSQTQFENLKKYSPHNEGERLNLFNSFSFQFLHLSELSIECFVLSFYYEGAAGFQNSAEYTKLFEVFKRVLSSISKCA